MRGSILRKLALCISLLWTSASPAEQTAIDPNSGLIQAEGWQLVLAHCGACHSYKLVTTQRGDERFWDNTIDWMQRTQKLWDIPQPQRQQIVAYLAKNYAESEWGRRPPLPASLMPDD